MADSTGEGRAEIIPPCIHCVCQTQEAPRCSARHMPTSEWGVIEALEAMRDLLLARIREEEEGRQTWRTSRWPASEKAAALMTEARRILRDANA